MVAPFRRAARTPSPRCASSTQCTKPQVLLLGRRLASLVGGPCSRTNDVAPVGVRSVRSVPP